MLINIKSKAQIISEIIQYIKSRFPLADVVPNTVIRDLNVEAPATYFYDTYKVVAFLEQVLDLNNLQVLLENSDERAKLAAILGITIDVMEKMITDIVELWASNYGLVRKAGTKATGLIAFYAKIGNTIPPSGIRIPAGTRVTIPNTNLVFRTLIEGILKQEDSYFNNISQQYEVVVPAEAELVGSQGNVPSNTITQLYAGQQLDVIPINYSNFNGGSNPESDLELLNRIKLVYTGNFHGTAHSILSRVLAYPFVQDAKVVYLPNDPSKISSGISDIDVFVKSTASAIKTYNTVFETLYNNSIPLQDKYVAYINKVKILDNNYTFQPQLYQILTNNLGKSFVHFNTTFRSDKDKAFFHYNSSGGFDFFKIKLPDVSDQFVIFPDGNSPDGTPISNFGRISITRKLIQIQTQDIVNYNDTPYWYFTGNQTTIKRHSYSGVPSYETVFEITILPESGDNIEINYVYNDTLQKIYDELNSPANLFLGQFINVFQAEQVPITVKAIVQISPSYALTDKATECKTAISNYLGSLPLGALINETDIVNILLRVPGVVDVKIPLQELSTPLLPGTGDIKLASKQFASAGVIEIIAQYSEVINR